MVKLPEYTRLFMEMAEVCPSLYCKSTESRKLAVYAGMHVREMFRAHEVEVITEGDELDPYRKRLKITFESKEYFAGITNYKYHTVKMDPGMAVYLASLVRDKKLSRPTLSMIRGRKVLLMHNGRNTRHVSNVIYKELYPGTTRRECHVDGDHMNMCNWNVYPKPFVSFFNMVRWDGRNWYLKLLDNAKKVQVICRTEEGLIRKLMQNRQELEGLTLDVSPRERDKMLFGDECSMVDYFAHLDRMVKWSPTKDLSPYIKAYREENSLWSVDEID